tara:strand:+ start:31 stop:495 length:465 start_codon:yes stop_codon:yes gene_type:complete
MSFIGDVFGAYGARQIGRFNADLYAKQAELARKNAEIKKQVFQTVDLPRLKKDQARNRSNQFVNLLKSGFDVDRIGETPYLIGLEQSIEDAFEISVQTFNSTVAYQNEINNSSLLMAKGQGEKFKGEIQFRTGMFKAAGKAAGNYQSSGSILTA